MDINVENKIKKLNKVYDYQNKETFKLFQNMTEEEKELVLSDESVKETILAIRDIDILKRIFRIVPASFQEVMFESVEIQNLLIAPNKNTLREGYLESLYLDNVTLFDQNKIRQLEVFIKTIKSPRIYEQIIDNKLFQTIVAMSSEKDVNKNFFGNIDIERLYGRIINNKELYNSSVPITKRRNIIRLFNKVSNHILLPDDFQNVVGNAVALLENKKHKFYFADEVVVDKQTIKRLTNSAIEVLLGYRNIDKELIKDTITTDVTNKINSNSFDFDEVFSHLLGDSSPFHHVDDIYFKIIIENCRNNPKLKEKFTSFLSRALFSDNLEIEDLELAKEALMRRIELGSTTYDQYWQLFTNKSNIKTIFFIKFGITSYYMNYLNGITQDQIMKLNVKHINAIKNKLNFENEDEISNLYGAAIKLYLVFGLERSLRILDENYGKIDRVFLENIIKLDVTNVKMTKEGKKFLPKLNDDFIKFLFVKENENHFIDMLGDKNSLLYKYWPYFYNNYNEIKNRCHGTITLKKLNIILSELEKSKGINITPDNYRLEENEILNDISLGNKTGKSDEEVINEVISIYEKMKKRTESSIPYVKGTCSNGYSYEMMKLDNPIGFTLGYKGNCCIRTFDIAHNHLLHALLCRNGRILIIYNEKGEIAAFSPLKRNGEVLIANSIECSHKSKNDYAIDAFSEAIKDIVKVSKENEHNDNLKLVCIGRNSYAKPKGIPFSDRYKTPTIYEKNDPIYTNTDTYHRRLDIIYSDSGIDLGNIKYGNPKASYQDPRENVKSCEPYFAETTAAESAIKVINAVNYVTCKYNLDDYDPMDYRKFKYYYKTCIYNNDWYILIDRYETRYEGAYLPNNPQAQKEYELALEEIKKNHIELKPYTRKLER